MSPGLIVISLVPSMPRDTLTTMKRFTPSRCAAVIRSAALIDAALRTRFANPHSH